MQFDAGMRQKIRIEQNVLVRSVINIVLTRYKAAKILETVPIVTYIEFIRMTPYIKDFRLVGLQGNELLAQTEKFVPLGVV